jgi:GTPase SAR1 family protein
MPQFSMGEIGLVLDRLDAAIAGRVGSDWWTRARARVREEMERGLVRVAVIGRFNTGKSTLINALVGSDLLPRDWKPTSAVVVEVVHGDQERLVQFRGDAAGAEEVLDRETFRRVARGAETGQGLRVLRATIPGTALPPGVAFVDTPGVGSLEKVHAEITYGYLGGCDAILFLLDGQIGTVTQDEIDFLRSHILKRDISKLVFVVTRVDMDGHPEEEQKRIVAEIADVVHRLPGLAETPVVRVNALAALESRLQGKGLSEAGLGDLMELLNQHFFRHLHEMRERRVLRVLEDVVATARASVMQHKEALTLDDPVLAERVAKAERARQDVRDAIAAAKAQFADARAALMRDLAGEAGRAVAKVARKAPHYVQTLIDNPSSGERVSALIRADLAREVEALVESWLKPRLTKLLAGFDTVGAEVRLRELDLGVEVPAMPGGPILDAIVDIGVIVLIDVVLPGGVLEALLARALAKGIFDKVRDVVKGLVLKTAQGVIRGILEKQLSDAIFGIEPQLRDALAAETGNVIDEAARKIEMMYTERLHEVTRALDAARAERSTGMDKIRQAIREDERAMEELAAIETMLRRALGGDSA